MNFQKRSKSCVLSIRLFTCVCEFHVSGKVKVIWSSKLSLLSPKICCFFENFAIKSFTFLRTNFWMSSNSLGVPRRTYFLLIFVIVILEAVDFRSLLSHKICGCLETLAVNNFMFTALPSNEQQILALTLFFARNYRRGRIDEIFRFHFRRWGSPGKLSFNVFWSKYLKYTFTLGCIFRGVSLAVSTAIAEAGARQLLFLK